MSAATPELLIALINLGAVGVILALLVRGDLRTRQEVETMQRIVDTLLPAIERANQTIGDQTRAIRELGQMLSGRGVGG